MAAAGKKGQNSSPDFSIKARPTAERSCANLLAIGNPRPVPVSFVLKNGSKRRFSGGS
jgi:hypothetical protein